MLYDEVLDRIGGWGRYQKIICFLLALGAIPTGYFNMSTVFTNKTPEYRCRIPEIDNSTQNATISSYNATGLEKFIPWDTRNQRYSRCKMFNMSSFSNNETSLQDCSFGYVYDITPGRVTAVTEWDLVCDLSFAKPRITSMYMAGVLVGSLILGALGDRFGRWPVTIGALYSQFVFLALNIFNVSPTMYAVLLFLAGSCSLIYFVAAVVLVTELVDTERRAFVEMMIMLGYSFGYILLPVSAYFTPSWRWILLIVGLSGALFIPYWWLIPESPRWLIITGRFQKARHTLENIARKNRKRVAVDSIFSDEHFKLIAETTKEPTKVSTDKCSKFTTTIPYLDLFIRPGMILKTLCSCFSWFVISLVYVTLNLNTGNLGGSDYINCFISAALEIPAYISVYLILRNKGRRSTMIAYMAISATACMATPLLNKVSTIGGIVCAMAGKFFVTCIFSLVYIVTAELFPTEGRNQALGICSMCARAGAVIAPYIIYAGETGSTDVPYFIMGSFAIAACFTNMLLPETQGITLPDTYEEAMTSESSFWLCRLRRGKKKSKQGEIQPVENIVLS